MNMSRLISNENIKLIEKLNSLLEEAGNKWFITIKEVDTSEVVGIILTIPSIFDEDKDKFELPILEKIKTSNLSITQLIDSINYDLMEVLLKIEPDFNKLTRIKKAFTYNYRLDKYNNTEKFNIIINVYEDSIRHNK